MAKIPCFHKLAYEDGDSTAIWTAIKEYTENELPYPGWVREELKIMADSILDINKGGKDFRQEVVDAVWINQKDLSVRHKIKRDIAIFDAIRHSNGTIDEAYEKLAEIMGLSAGTIENIYKKMRSADNKEFWGNVEKEGG